MNFPMSYIRTQKIKKGGYMTIIKNNADVKDFIPGSFNHLFNNFFSEVAVRPRTNKFFPSANVVESEKVYEIYASLPGLHKEDIKIDLQDGKLSISGERKLNKEEGKTFHSVEIAPGEFFRAFYLPEDATSEGIEAEYKDGILKINIPKDEKRSYKATIQVK
jgi:HSP20 family protein